MTRKDSDKDSERPHYYSQFWLDVAAGRRIIGGPRPEDVEQAEPETVEPVLPRKTGRGMGQSETYSARSTHDGRFENIVHPVAEPTTAPEEFIEPDVDELDLGAGEADDLDLQTSIEDTDIPDMDLSTDEEEEDLFEEEEEEEEEEDIGWGGGRGRKKGKPSRPAKPVVKKPGRREPRRGGY